MLFKYYPHIKPLFYFTNNKIGSFFRRVPRAEMFLRSSVVYKYKCDCCEQFYVGSTKLQLYVRKAQHFGVSHLTNRPLSSPMNSAIRDHSDKHNHSLKNNNFYILGSVNDEISLRMLETMYIVKMRPTLNNSVGAMPLHII